MRLPSLKYLKTFQVASARLSFKDAADELCITPSAISHQMKSLEEQLGVQLFERGPHALTLTEAGRNYQAHMNALFSRLEAVTEQLRLRYGRAVVRLHVAPFFATELLLARLPALLQTHPELDIHINTVSAALQTHPPEADLSIVVDAAPNPELHRHKLFSQTFVPACAPALMQRSPLRRPEDLNSHSLITHESRRDGWHRWADGIGLVLRPKSLIRFDTMRTAAEAAECGVGVALLSTRLVNDRLSKGTLLRLFDAELCTGESYFLLSRPEDAARPEVRAVASWILQEFGGADEKNSSAREIFSFEPPTPAS